MSGKGLKQNKKLKMIGINRCSRRNKQKKIRMILNSIKMVRQITKMELNSHLF